MWQVERTPEGRREQDRVGGVVVDALSRYAETATPNDGYINFCGSYGVCHRLVLTRTVHPREGGSDAETEFTKRQPWARRVGLDLAMVFADAISQSWCGSRGVRSAEAVRGVPGGGVRDVRR